MSDEFVPLSERPIHQLRARALEFRQIAEDAGTTRIDLEHRNLERFGDRTEVARGSAATTAGPACSRATSTASTAPQHDQPLQQGEESDGLLRTWQVALAGAASAPAVIANKAGKGR
jgi:hypothetical protein